jgi:hypothetical protein
MSWKQERDLLIAQTLAFVQSVTGKVPDADLVHASVQASPEPKPGLPVKPVLPEASLPKASAVASSETTSPVILETPVAALPVRRVTPLGPLPQLNRGDLRDDIRRRVEAFRARQQAFDRDRDEYCNAMMAKARAASGDTTEVRDNQPLKR